MSDLDLVVRNGIVVDGTGAARYAADVGVADGRIVELGRIARRGKREIDAEGHIVTPGFIDGHTHMDAQIHWDPLGRNSCWHGVTTAVMGNCGFTIAPMRIGQQALVTRNLERAEDISGDAMNAGIEWRWESFDEYLDVLDAMPKGINYANYVGHSALRTWAMGERAFTETASEADLALMVGELRRALDAGAAGFSTSRSASHETADDRPVASRLADWDEVCGLVSEMKGRRAAVFSLANEHVGIGTTAEDEYYDRLARLAVESGVTTTFGVVGEPWRKQTSVCDAVAAAGGRMIGQSHSRGISVLLSFKTVLPFDKLPGWAEFRKLPLASQATALRFPQTRATLVDAVKDAVYGRALGAEARPPEWDKLFVYDKPMPPFRSIGEIAAGLSIHPIEAMIDVALAHDLDVFFMQPLTGGTLEERAAMMRHPHTVMTFSDSGAHVGQIADSSIQSHMIAYWVRERNEFTLEEAVATMTSGPASVWGFQDRGIIREGNVADLIIFDPTTFGPAMPEVVHDVPTGSLRLSQQSVGMLASVIGGEVLIENGRHTGALPGKLLRRQD
jgi:N-acyl-D-amino-acid deacylase